MKIFVLFVFLFSCSITYSQSGITPNNLPPGEIIKYSKPLSTYLGTYFNTGSYYNANVRDGFGFKFSIVGMWTNIPEDQKTFIPEPGVEGIGELPPTATIFGDKASYFVSEYGYFTYPTGLALKSIPLGIYQAAFSYFNTEVMFKYFPKSNFDKANFGLLGFGIKHEISSHFPGLPVDISLQLLVNNSDAEYKGDEVDQYAKIKNNNFAINAHVSKTFEDIFIVYSGFQFESSSMDLTYYFNENNDYFGEQGQINQQVDVDAENKFRFTLGGAVKLGFFVFNADINLTKYTTFSSGISFDF